MKKVLYAAALLFLETACTPKPDIASPSLAIVAVI